MTKASTPPLFYGYLLEIMVCGPGHSNEVLSYKFSQGNFFLNGSVLKGLVSFFVKDFPIHFRYLANCYFIFE